MERPDITQAQVVAWIGTVVAVAGVLGSEEVGLGDSPPWVRLVIAAALVGAVAVSHIFGDAKIRPGRAVLAAAQADQAAAQLRHLTATPEGDDSKLTSTTTSGPGWEPLRPTDDA